MKPKKMPGSPQEWLNHAKSDLRLVHLAATDELMRREQACFHAQQAAEKAIKAVLVLGGIEFPFVFRLAMSVRSERPSYDCNFNSQLVLIGGHNAW
jgi:hypothetical protein